MTDEEKNEQGINRLYEFEYEVGEALEDILLNLNSLDPTWVSDELEADLTYLTRALMRWVDDVRFRIPPHERRDDA